MECSGRAARRAGRGRHDGGLVGVDQMCMCVGVCGCGCVEMHNDRDYKLASALCSLARRRMKSHILSFTDVSGLRLFVPFGCIHFWYPMARQELLATQSGQIVQVKAPHC